MAEGDRIPVVDYSRTSRPVFSNQNNQMEFDNPQNNSPEFHDQEDAGNVTARNYARNVDSVFDNQGNIIPSAEIGRNSNVAYERLSQPMYSNSSDVQASPAVSNSANPSTELETRFTESLLEYARHSMAMYENPNNRGSEPAADYPRSNDQLFTRSTDRRPASAKNPEPSVRSLDYQSSTQIVVPGDFQPRQDNDQVHDYAKNNSGSVESVAEFPRKPQSSDNKPGNCQSNIDNSQSSAQGMQSCAGSARDNVADTPSNVGSTLANVGNACDKVGNTQASFEDTQGSISSTQTHVRNVQSDGGGRPDSSDLNRCNVRNTQSDVGHIQVGVTVSNTHHGNTAFTEALTSLGNTDTTVADTQLGVEDTKIGIIPAVVGSSVTVPMDISYKEASTEVESNPIKGSGPPMKRRRKARAKRYPRKAHQPVYRGKVEPVDAETDEVETIGDQAVGAREGQEAEAGAEKEKDGVEGGSRDLVTGEIEGKEGTGKKEKNILPPLPNGRKKHSIPLWRKIEILKEFDKKPAGMSRRRLVGELGLKNRSTLSSILGSREKIMAEYLNSTSDKQRDRRRMRSLKYDDIEEVITKWMEQCKLNKLPINGIVIQKKAERLAKKLGHVQFKASNGWLDRFKARNAVNLKEFSGKSADMSSAVDEPIYEWKELCLPVLIREYEACDIFVCAGGGILFGLLPNEIAAAHGEQCLKGENSKERITFCPCVNMDGTEKEALILVGDFSQKSQYSYGGILTSGAVHSEMDENSWVTPDSFYSYVLSLDSKMQLDDRHIILFTDEKYAKLEEKKNKELKNVSLKTIPIHFNPMNRGILKSIKSEYRYCQMKKMLSSLGDDMKGTLPKVTVQDAAKMLETAWKELSASTIQSCFLDAGFEKKMHVHLDEPEESKEAILASLDDKKHKEKTPDSRLHLFKKLKQYYKLPESLHFEDYLNADDELATCDEGIPEMPVEDILPTMDIMLPDDHEPERPEHSGPPPQEILTPQDAVTALGKVRRFLQMHNDWGNVPPAFFFSLDTIEQYVIDERMRSTFSGQFIPSASNLTASVMNAANLSSMSNMSQGVTLAGAGSPPPNPSTPNTAHSPQVHMHQSQRQGMGSMVHMPNSSGHNTPIPQNTSHSHNMPSNLGHFHGNMGHHPFVGNVPIGHIPGNPSGHIAGNTGQWTAIYQNPNNFSPN
ncbi:uncharacterized protein LOC135503304 isoform X1 [Lineus longissimus]|uniref:uncharacterized protein LOC135503304 isoform X1 n=1 Tax=Lineus longissimus TaxID=88925 RepID=UPI002B4ED70A